MFPEVERFERWLRRRSPQAATPIHYSSDLKLFLVWAGQPAPAVTLHDVDATIEPIADLGQDSDRHDDGMRQRARHLKGRLRSKMSSSRDAPRLASA